MNQIELRGNSPPFTRGETRRLAEKGGRRWRGMLQGYCNQGEKWVMIGGSDLVVQVKGSVAG